MANDMEMLAKALLGNGVGEKVSANYGKFAQILQSPQGKEVLASLLQDGGDSLKKAADNAKKGDMSGAQQIISNILSTKEGSETIKKIIAAASE